MENIKQKIIAAINIAVPLSDYESEDCIYSQKYNISSTNMVYILLRLADEFGFTITPDFIDSLEACTFARLEGLLEQHQGTATATVA